MRAHNVTVLLAAVCISACGGKTHFADDYRNGIQRLWELPSRMKYADRVIGKSGSHVIRERDFAYEGVEGVTIQPSDLQNMDAGIRSLTIRKEVLRRLIIEEGIREGIYVSADAAAFLQPRLEKILEEYYYYKKGNMESLAARIEKSAPDDAALAALIKSDTKLAKSGARMLDLKRERALLIRRITERRADEERQKLIREIIQKNPPIEVFP